MATAAPITATDNSQIFNDRLMGLMGMLDDMMEKYKIGDGEYLTMANELLAMNRLVGSLKNTTKYVFIEREVRRREMGKAPKKKPSLAEKMTNPDYIWCKDCNSPIKKSFMPEHKKTAKCSTITQIKRTALKIKTMGNPAFQSRALVINRFLDANRIPLDAVITQNWEGQDPDQTKLIQKIHHFCIEDEDVFHFENGTNPTFAELIQYL